MLSVVAYLSFLILFASSLLFLKSLAKYLSILFTFSKVQRMLMFLLFFYFLFIFYFMYFHSAFIISYLLLTLGFIGSSFSSSLRYNAENWYKNLNKILASQFPWYIQRIIHHVHMGFILEMQGGSTYSCRLMGHTVLTEWRAKLHDHLNWRRKTTWQVSTPFHHHKDTSTN